MKVKMLIDEQDGTMFYPKGCIRHVDDYVGEALIEKKQAIRMPDDTRARIVPYQDTFCVPLNMEAGSKRIQARQ